VLVPQVDADGNERDGVRSPELAVPLATLFANENVMGAGDVPNQVGERLILPVLAGARRCGCHALLQTVQSFVNGDFGFGAGLTEGATPATAVIDSQLFEFARRIGYFNGEFADGGCNCHFLVSFYGFPTLIQMVGVAAISAM